MFDIIYTSSEFESFHLLTWLDHE